MKCSGANCGKTATRLYTHSLERDYPGISYCTSCAKKFPPSPGVWVQSLMIAGSPLPKEK